MEVVIAESVQPVATTLDRTHQVRELRLVLRDDDRLPPRAASRTRFPMAAMMFSGKASKICCVASSRSPSMWNSSIQ